MPKYDFKQSFSGFVWTVFKNLVKDSIKKHKDIAFSTFDDNDDWSTFEENLQDDFDIFEILESEFEFSHIEDAMKQLDSDCREIIYLKFIEERDNSEIADMLQISNENVRQKISRDLNTDCL